MRQRVQRSCSNAVDVIRSIRERIGHGYRSTEVTAEQKSNFAPYSHRSKTPRKPQSWTLKAFCLSSRNATKVPSTSREREILVAAGLGEKKVFIPDVCCSWDEFKSVLVANFPKLENAGGFEFLRCIPNTKDLETISLKIARSPKLLKSVVASGRVFLRPIQQDLPLDGEEAFDSAQVIEI